MIVDFNQYKKQHTEERKPLKKASGENVQFDSRRSRTRSVIECPNPERRDALFLLWESAERMKLWMTAEEWEAFLDENSQRRAYLEEAERVFKGASHSKEFYEDIKELMTPKEWEQYLDRHPKDKKLLEEPDSPISRHDSP